jgi:hypothetical protein
MRPATSCLIGPNGEVAGQLRTALVGKAFLLVVSEVAKGCVT